VPAGQSTHEDVASPGELEYLPGVQVPHDAMAAAPTWFEEVPMGHAEHPAEVV
jgi:hypothetical protein